MARQQGQQLKSGASRPVWRSLTVRIFAALTLVSFLSIAVAILILDFQSRRIVFKSTGERTLFSAGQAADDMARHASGVIQGLELRARFVGRLSLEPSLRVGIIENIMEAGSEIAWLGVMDHAGAIVAEGGSRPTRDMPAGSGSAPFLTDGTNVSSTVLTTDRRPSFLVSTPVPSASEASEWLVAELRLEGVRELPVRLAAGGERSAYVVTRDGSVIAAPSFAGIDSHDPLPVFPLPVDIPEKGVVLMQSAGRSDTYFTAYCPVGVLGWIVVVRQPVQEAYLHSGFLLGQSLSVALVGLAVSLLLGAFLSRVIVRPFHQLLDGTRMITAGDLGYRIRMKGPNEVIRLAESFNSMVESLQVRTAELVRSETDYRLMAERVNDIIFTLDASRSLTYVSPRLEAITGYSPVRALGAQAADHVSTRERADAEAVLDEMIRADGRLDREVQVELETRDGRTLLMEVHLTADSGADGARQVYGVARDVSERARLLTQLGQAQKMEAVGRLAGGIAHDFNNLLTAIIGYCDYSLLCLDDPPTLRRNLSEIRSSGNRAASLTQQLLAFSRRQVMAPRALRLPRLMENMRDLLTRLLGEDISLEIVAADDTGVILADPVQVEQVVMNLCINARDAMTGGGRIRVEIANAHLESKRDERFDVAAGDYVRLAITDYGVGMDADTRAHLFEPFFTTKAPGKGTGLGLSTVYGIVKQTGGYIWVESAPNAGSTFEIFFPRSTEGVVAAQPAAPDGPTRGGCESILLVEDEERIRTLVADVLRRAGYTVGLAHDAGSAIEAFDARNGDFSLIVSDVILPDRNGRDLVRLLVARRPGLRSLFVSGYARDVIDTRGILDPGIAYLQKPFTMEGLLSKVRSILDAGPS